MMPRILATLLACVCWSCASLPAPGVPVTGTWGGDHIKSVLSKSGGEIEYDCARGTITEPLTVNDNGQFDVRGFHFRGHGGPVRMDEKPDSAAARYTGRIRDDIMTLDVSVEGAALASYSLLRGRDGSVFKCL